jgi:cell division protein FtsB
MPEYALWTLIISLAIFAFGLMLKIVDLKARLKASEDEPDRLRSKLKTLEARHDKEISDIKELNERKMDKLIKESTKFIHDPVDLSKYRNDTSSEYNSYDPLGRNKK